MSVKDKLSKQGQLSDQYLKDFFEGLGETINYKMEKEKVINSVSRYLRDQILAELILWRVYAMTVLIILK